MFNQRNELKGEIFVVRSRILSVAFERENGKRRRTKKNTICKRNKKKKPSLGEAHSLHVPFTLKLLCVGSPLHFGWNTQFINGLERAPPKVRFKEKNPFKFEMCWRSLFGRYQVRHFQRKSTSVFGFTTSRPLVETVQIRKIFLNFIPNFKDCSPPVLHIL